MKFLLSKKFNICACIDKYIAQNIPNCHGNKLVKSSERTKKAPYLKLIFHIKKYLTETDEDRMNNVSCDFHN